MGPTGLVLMRLVCIMHSVYGFPIHGAINGYYRKILWLELVRSNNRPEVPARFYYGRVMISDS